MIRSIMSYWFSWACYLQVLFLSLVYCVWLIIQHQLDCVCQCPLCTTSCTASVIDLWLYTTSWTESHLPL